MKKLTGLLLLLCVTTGSLFAQNKKANSLVRRGENASHKTQATYTFSYSTGTYLPLSEPNSLNNGSTWDDPSYILQLPFTFTFYDQQWDSIGVVDYIAFEPNLIYWIDPIYSDFIDRGYDSVSISPIGYLIEGPPGNQVVKIEWRNAGFFCQYDLGAGTPDSACVQVWLFEGSNRIEIHIGPSYIGAPMDSYCGNSGPQVGVWFDDGTSHESLYLDGDPANPVTVADDATYTTFLDSTPEEGMIYVFDYVAPVSLQPAGSNNYLQLFPNPTDGKFEIISRSAGEATFEIQDLWGQILFTGSLKENEYSTSLDLTFLPSGIYHLRFEQGKTISTHKLVIQ